ncbi:MAG: hypothetical protein IMZ55_06730 [Acidobacteria bacterium]|nr:hypothetical protein [Planctomycetota bacterium]MBE3133149.1 hypothetical protein [Acidobacteriota bacterium]
MPTAFDGVVEAERAPRPFRYLLVGIDFYGRNEFGLIPLVRREWPETVIVAYHSPGFEHKARIAELLGAHIILAKPDQVSAFLEGLAASPMPIPGPGPFIAATQASRQLEAEPESPPRPAGMPREPAAEDGLRPLVLPDDVPPPSPRLQDIAAPEEAPEPTHPVRSRAPEEDKEEAWRKPPDAHEPMLVNDDDPLAKGRVIGTVELTEEELRLLLGEDEES